MHEPDFWTNCAEAMELSIEGNRLIAREVADFLGDFWRSFARPWAEWWHDLHTHRHLPPL
jgi:hypothetical protein